MKNTILLVLLFFYAGSLMSEPYYSYGSKSKKKKKKTQHSSTQHKTTGTSSATKKKSDGEYTGALVKIFDPKAENPSLAGFVMDGHYQFTVVETVTPTIRVSGVEQPKIHICVEGASCQNQQGRCIDGLANGYGNMYWEADASTKCYLTAYKPDGTKIRLKKELLITKPKSTWKGNEVTWEDSEYKVRIKISKCKVVGNHVCICPH